MVRRPLVSIAVVGLLVGFLRVESANAVPAFARQYDLQCVACHTQPPRLNRFGEQFHMMGFQIPSAARPDGLLGSLREDDPAKVVIDSLALRIAGGLFDYTKAPQEGGSKFEPPDEITLYLTRAITPDLSMYLEFEYQPNAVEFEGSRGFVEESRLGLGKEAFFMLNLGRFLGALGAPTMAMGNQTMVGEHGKLYLHGPMLMAGKVDPNTNFSYATNRQLILDTELEVKNGEVERLPIVPYAFASKFFGLFKNRQPGEPQLVTDQVMYNTTGRPGADFHTMINDVVLAQVGFLHENEGWNTYAMVRYDLLDRRDFTFNVSALINWGFGVANAPNPANPDQPSSSQLDRLRYGLAANARWKALDVYGALIWDRLYKVPGGFGSSFDRNAAGLTFEVDYRVLEKLLFSTRFDQLWAGGLTDQKQDGSVLSIQARFTPWQNIAFFVRDSVNLRSVIEDNPLRNWRNQLFVGIDWDF